MSHLKRMLSPFLCLSLMITVLDMDACAKKSDNEQAQSGSTQPQGSSGQAAAPNQAPATTYAQPTADQLYQLVAPIALFPDNLVAQVLAASTYPDQITAAYQWVQQNSTLKGQDLLQAVDKQPWDASVKGVTQFPDVLQQMATNLSWTSALGDAYYNIPQSVMNAVQVMRQRAYQSGNLKSNQQQNVSVQNQAAGAAPPPQEASSGQPQTVVVQAPPQTIVIQPAQPQVVYVPTYNPTAVYGAPVPAYPGYSTGAMVATGLISFGLGVAVGAAINNGGCCGWGWNSWGCGWHNSTVVYNRNVYVSNSNTFVNRNNYYANRNYNNVNVNNVNRNNINTNNINRNNVNTNNINRNNVNANNINRNNVNANNANRNNLNANNRTNNFNSNYSAPHFNQNLNQSQYRNANQGNLGGAQQRNPNQGNLGGAQQRPAAQQGNFNQQNRAGANQAQSRPANFNQNQRQPERGYGQQASPHGGSGAFGNYQPGGNARTNSARGQQSLSGGHSGGFHRR